MSETASLEIGELREAEVEAAVALWREAGLLRPWNDPRADIRLALAGPSSAIIAARFEARLAATVMVGWDGHRGWIYYLAVARDLQRRGDRRADGEGGRGLARAARRAQAQPDGARREQRRARLLRVARLSPQRHGRAAARPALTARGEEGGRMLAWASIVRAIEQRGLAAHGAFALADDERKGELADVATMALVGLGGRRGWAAFSASPEVEDGAADPLDRWSRRVVDGLAVELGARALYPFDGPPHWPFQRWARRAAPMHVSPLGLLIHRRRRIVARLSRRARLRRAPRGPAGPRREEVLARPALRGLAFRPVRSAPSPARTTTSPPARSISAVPLAAPAWRAAALLGAPVRSAPSAPKNRARRRSICAPSLPRIAPPEACGAARH